MSEKAQISGIMYVQLDAYLRRLRAIEGRKPENKRRNVPTMTQLAEVAGISRNSLSRISRGYTKSLNLEIAGAIRFGAGESLPLIPQPRPQPLQYDRDELGKPDDATGSSLR